VEDAVTSLNPVPILDAAIRGGFAKCKKVTLPVGDAEGRIASRFKPSDPWITGPIQTIGGRPHQTRWVFEEWISSEDYDKTKKTEGFRNTLFSIKTSQAAAVLLLGALVAGIYVTRTKK
jgi:hypothetical protein